jgi:biopolymer transport protein ExbB
MLELINNIGFLFYPLSIFSILSLLLIVERAIYFIHLFKFSKNSFYDDLLIDLKNNKNINKSFRDEIISCRLLEIKELLEAGINFLRIMAVLSPMIGLLGTVIGMIKAFKTIANLNSPIVPATIADGLWNAMLTTAYGLSIAIPALLAVFIYSRISEKYLLNLQKLLNQESLKLEGVKFRQIQKNNDKSS